MHRRARRRAANTEARHVKAGQAETRHAGKRATARKGGATQHQGDRATHHNRPPDTRCVGAALASFCRDFYGPDRPMVPNARRPGPSPQPTPYAIVESPFGRKLDGMMELNSAPSIDVRPVITHPPSPPCLAGHDSKGVTMTRSRLFLCREQLVGLRANPLLLIRQAVAVRQRQRLRARPFEPCLALAPPVKT